MNKKTCCSPSSDLKCSLWSIINTADLALVKLLIGAGSILWGLQLLMPGNTYDRPMFSVIKYVMPENLLGTLFLTQGTLAVYALVRVVPRLINLLVNYIHGSFLWSLVTVGMLISPVYLSTMTTQSFPAATSPAIIITIASLWVLARHTKRKL